MFLTVKFSNTLSADGVPRINQMCATGAARVMWPIRSRRAIDLVTKLPSLSTAASRERTPLSLESCGLISLTGPKIRSQNKPSRSGFWVR